MIRELENALLGSDIDCENYDLLNVEEVLPVPVGLVDTEDSRLSDQRSVVAGSVTNDSVSDTAGIVQSKLNMNGSIPTPWLGDTVNQAAIGNDVERVANKSALNGYAPLDSEGKLPSSYLPSTGPQTGTVTWVDLKLPSQLSVSGNPITGSGTFAATWGNAPDNSWFGVHGLIGILSGVPSFLTKQIPIALVPSLSGAKFTTGEFTTELLPVATPMGVGHAKGIVPDTGDGSLGADTDYLARDMTFKHFDSDLAYQPTLPDVNIFLNTYLNPSTAYVTIRSKVPYSSLFYMVSPDTTFIEAEPGNEKDVHITIMVSVGDKINAYAAKVGYNNSGIAAYTVPSPPNTFV